MANTITIICPECEKSLKAPPEIVGKKIRCKGCGHTFAARAPQSGKAAGKAGRRAGKEEEEEAGAYGMREEYLGPRCPDCANEMQEGEIICLHCGYNTQSRQKLPRRKVRETTGGDIFLWLLPGILCALVVVILITADLLYIFLIDREMFQEAWYDFIGGKGMKIWISIVLIFIMYLAGKFAVKRLIFHNTPPEIEEKLVQ
jgi:hypothetical protein